MSDTAHEASSHDTAEPVGRTEASTSDSLPATGLAANAKAPVSSEVGEGRFPAGTLLGGRYRIVSLLGRGGMGEVYRASDLKLKQPVALKFLSESTAQRAHLLERFHREVRLARQISHPNVCRVYDIGDFEGVAYISMEYIDGEDLASLLRRIGRLPHDKALEIARRLCAGLAAAHDKGVVHRDLKPANIMIDGRGQVFITDFGLAATPRELALAEGRSGTPAYMAPEQLLGEAVSLRSDLYSLGLVLYEMFTGRRPFDRTRKPSDRPPRISIVTKDLDPAVARAIERCLETDPHDRPISALAVAATLPGAHPLAEALAAGITPSPQLVAASREADAMSIRKAVLSLVFIVAGLAATVLLGNRVSVLRLTPFENPPEALTLKAREMIAGFGYTAAPFDTASAFFRAGNYQRYAELREPRAEYQEQLARGRPALIGFWYRQSPNYLLPFGPESIVSQTDPPVLDPGEVSIWLDQTGRLANLLAVPPREDYSSQSNGEADWDALFRAAGVDRSRFAPTESEWIPPVTFDARAAWSGTYAYAPSVPMRIEAAAWKGRPVYFRVIGPWTEFQSRPTGLTRAMVFGLWLVVAVSCAVLAGAALVARHNYRRGGGDARGAWRLSTVLVSISLLGWLITAHHVPSFMALPGSAFWALASALTYGMACWVLYMALEPFVRRRWPHSLITWARVLAGGIRDPLVGGHALAGTSFGVMFAIWLSVYAYVLLGTGAVRCWLDVSILQGPGWMLNALLSTVWISITETLGIFVMFLLLRAVLRRDWAAAISFVVLASAPVVLAGGRPLIDAIFVLSYFSLFLWILIRFGVLTMIVADFVSTVLLRFPVTASFSAWYSTATLFALATVLLLAIWSFRVALAGRPVLQDEFLEAGA